MKEKKMVEAICSGCGISFPIEERKYKEKKAWGKPMYHTSICFVRSGNWDVTIKQK